MEMTSMKYQMIGISQSLYEISKIRKLELRNSYCKEQINCYANHVDGCMPMLLQIHLYEMWCIA